MLQDSNGLNFACHSADVDKLRPNPGETSKLLDVEDDAFANKVEFDDGDIDDEIDPALKEIIDRSVRQIFWLLNTLATFVQGRYIRIPFLVSGVPHCECTKIYACMKECMQFRANMYILVPNLKFVRIKQKYYFEESLGNNNFSLMSFYSRSMDTGMDLGTTQQHRNFFKIRTQHNWDAHIN